MENQKHNKLKLISVNYRTQKGEKKSITNHELHSFLDKGFYRNEIAEKLNISPARLRKIMETANMWKMRAKSANVTLDEEQEEKEEAPIVEEAVVVSVETPIKRTRRPRVVKIEPKAKKEVIHKKQEAKQEANKILQDELDRIRQVRNSLKEETITEFRKEMQQELNRTVKSFIDTIKRATHFEEINTN